MAKRRKPNSGDFGPSGVARLLSLVSRPLKVSVLSGRHSVQITLTDYLRVKSGGGANQGFLARIAEITGGATQRIIVALRGDLGENVTLRETVARAQDPRAFDEAGRAARAALVNGVAAEEPSLALVRQALRIAPACDDDDVTRFFAATIQSEMTEVIPSFSMVKLIPFLLLLQGLAQNCANWVVFPATMFILQTLGLLTGDLDQDRALLKEWGLALLAELPNRVLWEALTFMSGEPDRIAKADTTFRRIFRRWNRRTGRRLSNTQYRKLMSTSFAADLRLFVNAIGGQGVGQLCTWLQFHQVPRAASAAVAAGIVVGALGDAATPEIVAGLIACRTEQILPAIEQYLYKQKGLARGDVD